MFHKVRYVIYWKSIYNVVLLRICLEVVVRSNYPIRIWIILLNLSTMSRNLRRRTSIVIRKRRKAPKMDDEQQQEVWARKNCGKWYRKLLNGCDLIIDDEKYFKLSGDNVVVKSLLLFNWSNCSFSRRQVSEKNEIRIKSDD